MTTDTRIESLETQVRTLKRMLLGVFGLVVVGGLLAATTLQNVPDVIQAKKFEVVNDAGQSVAGMQTTDDGEGFVWTWDQGDIMMIMADSVVTFNPNKQDEPPKEAEVPAPAADPSKAIAASNIVKEFENNKLAAETKYKNMGAFVLTGEFSEFGDVMNSSYTTYPVTFRDSSAFGMSPIAVQGLSRSYLESLNKGDQVTVKVKFVMVSEMMEVPVFTVVK